MKTTSRLYDNHGDAERAVRDLEAAGFTHDNVSIIAHDRGQTSTLAGSTRADVTGADNMGTAGSDSSYGTTGAATTGAEMVDRAGGFESGRPSAGYTSSPPGTSNLAGEADYNDAERSHPVGSGTTRDRVSSSLSDRGRPPDVTGTTTTADYTGGGTSPADPAHSTDSNTEAGTKRGAVAGGVVGGAIGLLTGIGAMAIPGVGPVVAAGWLVSTLAGGAVGAGAGGLVGTLTGHGVSKDESDVYAEGIRRGGAMVSVRTDEAREAEVTAILDRHNPADWQERRRSFGSDWRGFEPSTGTTIGTETTAPAAGSRRPDAGR